MPEAGLPTERREGEAEGGERTGSGRRGEKAGGLVRPRQSPTES